MRKEKKVILERVRTEDAAKELNMDILTLQHLLRQEKIPVGFAMRREGKSKYTYIIYRQFLDAFKETGKDPYTLWGLTGGQERGEKRDVRTTEIHTGAEPAAAGTGAEACGA